MITKAEAMTHRVFYHVRLTDSKGMAVQCRANGRCKEWKREPERFSLPVKYGLKTCFYLDNRNADEWSVTDPTPIFEAPMNKSYEGYAEFLGEERRKKIDHNTYVVMSENKHIIWIMLHGHTILHFHRDGRVIYYDSRGWPGTATTTARMAEYGPLSSVYRKNNVINVFLFPLEEGPQGRQLYLEKDEVTWIKRIGDDFDCLGLYADWLDEHGKHERAITCRIYISKQEKKSREPFCVLTERKKREEGRQWEE